ncbi:uncharacterized protein EAF01_000286 [Botrytis porri]|uniref:uncharacterized protein n=1 Tax=Botrytis porri TaxID=87229 RepID=UPI0018FF3A7E|nr:uncharacterized protein EAF01_000286 [Botrytis porri]KAF7913880.1 hypothetical protein EAF01_000286 [Botrytis porri]
MPFQIPETKAEQNVYAFRPHLLALPQSQKASSHYLEGKERKERRWKGLGGGNRNRNAQHLKKMTKKPSISGQISNS